MFSRIRRFSANKRQGFGAFYKKSLILTLFVASIPGIIIGGCVYWIVGGQINHELQSHNRQQINQSVSYFNNQFSHLELNMAHWSFDPSFGNELRRLDFVNDYVQVRNIFQTLLIMEMSDPLINHVELFLNEPRPVLFTRSEYKFLTDRKPLDEYLSLMERPKSINWMISEENGAVDLTLYNKLLGGSLSPFGTIFITLNKRQLTDMLLTLTPRDQGSSFLMTEQGQWLLSSNGEVPSALEEAVRSQVLTYGGSTNSFLYKWDKTTYSVSFGNIERLGSTWTFVSVAPLSAITAPVKVISQVIVWISLAGMLVAATLSWFASRKLYSPVNRLVQMIAGDRNDGARANREDEFAVIEAQWKHLTKERHSLMSRLSEQLPYLREGYLLQLVQGYLYSFSEEKIRERMEQYGWQVENKQFIALIIQLSGFANLQGRFYKGDEGLVTFVAANIVEELKDTGIGQSIVINFHDLSIGLLLLVPDRTSMEQFRTELSAFCENLIKAIQKVLSLRVTISVSKSSSQAYQIPYLFEEARQALSHRDLLHDMQIIGLNPDRSSEQSQRYAYPFAVEKEILHALRMGMRNELPELLFQFMKELTAGGSKEMIIRHGMLQLLASVQHAIMKMGVSHETFAGTGLSARLSQLDDPDEMLRWFSEQVIQPFLNVWDEQQDAKLMHLVEKVIQYMQNHYMKDISLDSCAEQINIPSYTLSKTFKQVTGLNFIEYLTGIRIEKAKEFLQSTDLRINDVAERVGYQPTYFNRIFKKLEGITPSQYREKNQLD
ncbi:helix-turn-helix protein [Cohnella sp. SGD-V74]|nr:helix-turn-helix protein [Cohnella sp. SGD-V74]